MIKRFLKAVIFLIVVFFVWQSAVAYDEAALEVRTERAGTALKVAPGEFLPITVKLLNFGSDRRVDVSVDYRILNDEKKEVVYLSETVAVETTASFVKLLSLPKTLSPGWYEAQASILYAGQEFPATSSFQFLVSRKFAGFFLSDWLVYCSLVLLFGLLVYFVSRFSARKNFSRFSLHDYSDIIKNDRVFYEIISDVISQMRLRVGDRAIDIAKSIEGLEIDENDYRIKQITKNPAKIIALLILKYENELGEKISFALRQTEDETKKQLKTLDKNLVIVRKYFE